MRGDLIEATFPFLARLSHRHADSALGAVVGLMIVGGTVASAWHGIAYTELAVIAGAEHVATALGLGNTFAFATYFLTPLAIPLILGVSAWDGVWVVTAAAALLAFFLFPRSPPLVRSV
ncbi:MAG TPA: hypothetical protein VFK10_13290 [Burkholderiaceae bacterium]|nr:hypothetical protein [Burkholderiaceae bacterium]